MRLYHIHDTCMSFEYIFPMYGILEGRKIETECVVIDSSHRCGISRGWVRKQIHQHCIDLADLDCVGDSMVISYNKKKIYKINSCDVHERNALARMG